jgi:NADH:ubiquinone oxidoreductase subunit 6 (subunit J)
MTLFALTPTQEAGGQIALAAALGVAGFFLLLPRPSGRFVPGGIAALLGAAVVFGSFLYRRFGQPMPNVIESALFWMFSAGALVFGCVLVAQKNPARGAIAFAFVILSTCGLFLLCAAPMLMAATIIIYAGAFIVTFLFVLMLSQTDGPADENDRSRDPLYGGFAGFAFAGLVLFALYQTSQAADANQTRTADNRLDTRFPAPVLKAEDRKALASGLAELDAASAELEDAKTNADRAKMVLRYLAAQAHFAEVAGQSKDGRNDAGTIRTRLEKMPENGPVPAVLFRPDQQSKEALDRAAKVRALAFTERELETMLMKDKPDTGAVKAKAQKLRDEVALLYGTGDLPAANVRALGLSLYSEHLLAVELAGTLLLVAVIGAVAVAQRKGVAK